MKKTKTVGCVFVNATLNLQTHNTKPQNYGLSPAITADNRTIKIIIVFSFPTCPYKLKIDSTNTSDNKSHFLRPPLVELRTHYKTRNTDIGVSTEPKMDFCPSLNILAASNKPSTKKPQSDALIATKYFSVNTYQTEENIIGLEKPNAI